MCVDTNASRLRVDTETGEKTLTHRHSHDSDAENLELLKITAGIKRRAVETMEV